jgi:hypothetical protein
MTVHTELRGRLFARDADDHAIRGASPFDLDPLAPPGPVASIRALCHDAFEAGDFAQPLTRQTRVRRLQQLETLLRALEAPVAATLRVNSTPWWR